MRLSALFAACLVLTACLPASGPASPTPEAPAALATAQPTTQLPSPSLPAPTSAPPGSAAPINVAREGRVAVSGLHQETGPLAVDGDPGSMWFSETRAPAWFALSYEAPQLVDHLELVVSQSPAGETTHEIYLGLGPDLTLITQLSGATSDGQTLTVPVVPARPATRVLIRTLVSPSFVAWREVRLFAQPQPAPAPPPPLKLRPFINDKVDFPVGITHAGDGSGRIFILQQQGRIWVVDANGQRRNQPFLEIAERVSCCTERGMLGLAFPPGYPQKRYFYVTYTSTARDGINLGDEVFSRFHLAADADAGNPRSEEILLVIPQASEAHHGGKLQFGPRDGYLYMSTGDGGPGGGAGGRAQQTGVLQGKILRIDTESGATPYAVPPNNPFVGRDGFRPEIWAYGLRNPWSMTIDPPTGDLYIADAGETEWEEVDVQRGGDPGGENYGWPRLEGRHCYPLPGCDPSGITQPITEYHHLEGCVIAGGAVARGPRYQRMQGWYLYGDFCSGKVWALRNENGAWVASQLGAAGFPISTIGRDEAGNVYVAHYAGSNIYLLEE